MANIESDPQRYKVTVTGPGVSLERETDQDIAFGVVQLVLTGTINRMSAFDSAIGGVEKRSPRLSLREYLDAVGAKSIPEKIAAFCKYLRDHNNQEDVSKDEIKACFRSAGESLPGNFPRDFTTAVQSGWIAEDHTKSGRFYLTRKGDELIRTQ